MTTLTAIKVISLENSTERRAAFNTQAADAKVEWSFFKALTSIAAPLTYTPQKAIRRHGRPLMETEIGCYASHFKCWEWLANSDCDQAIIFEDDVLVDWNIINIIARHRMSDYGIELLRFFAINPVTWKMNRARFISWHSHLIRNTCVRVRQPGISSLQKGGAHPHRKIYRYYRPRRQSAGPLLGSRAFELFGISLPCYRETRSFTYRSGKRCQASIAAIG